MSADGYSAKKTKINEDKLADWLREQVTGDLEQIPGIGPKNVELLKSCDKVPDSAVETTHQLIGQFLRLKTANASCGVGFLGGRRAGPDQAGRPPTPAEDCQNGWRLGSIESNNYAQVTPVEHCDMFYYWLQAKGVNAGRNNIVLAIAEKCEVFFPGCYDPAAYD